VTQSVFFLDTDFIQNLYGRAQGDADRFVRLLNVLYDQYDVRVTDRVKAESARDNINPETGQRYTKDQTFDNWLNTKNITAITTSVPDGNNVGERSIV